MPFDGSGNFNRVMNWVSDAAAAIKILATRHDAEDDNFASGLSNCLTKDGQTQPTANIPMNGKKLTNLGAPTGATDASTKAYADAIKVSPTFTGKVTLPTGTAALAPLNFPIVSQGPNTPADGDMWPALTNGALRHRIAGVTYTYARLEYPQIWAAQQTFQAGVTGLNPIGTATASLGEIAIFGVTGGAAMMQFNNGTFAAYIGIDADNSWKVGGYSMGANSYKLWHAGNDGAGSGLDADLLDGNQGAWYQQSLTDIVGFELGANLAGDRVSYFDMHADATNTDYSTRVLRNPGVNGVFAIDQKGTGGIAISSATGIISFTSSGSMGHNGNTIWTSGNDGAGSGLDADLLDGLNSNSAAGTGNTIAARDASGDLTVRTARVEFTSGGATGAYFLAMNAIGTTASGADNYSRPMTIAAAAAAMGAQVGTGSLGSYAMLRNDTAADVLPGGGIAGASTGYTNTLGDTSGSPGGSWRCMGYAKNNSNPVDRRCSIFVRFA